MLRKPNLLYVGKESSGAVEGCGGGQREGQGGSGRGQGRRPGELQKGPEGRPEESGRGRG